MEYKCKRCGGKNAIDEEKLYYAIQKIKKLSVDNIFQIYNQINDKAKESEFVEYSLTEKKYLMGYIEMMSDFKPELSDLFKKMQEKKSAELCIKFEMILLKKIESNRNKSGNQSDESDNKIKSFLSKLASIFG